MAETTGMERHDPGKLTIVSKPLRHSCSSATSASLAMPARPSAGAPAACGTRGGVQGGVVKGRLGVACREMQTVGA